MPVATVELMRGLLALLSLVFAHFFGRAIGKVILKRPKPRITGWALRTALAVLGLSWRAGMDRLMVTTCVLAAIACVLGVFLERRPRRQEDLTGVIFPRE
jgi:hypothetical protein